MLDPAWQANRRGTCNTLFTALLKRNMDNTNIRWVLLRPAGVLEQTISLFGTVVMYLFALLCDLVAVAASIMYETVSRCFKRVLKVSGN